VKLTLLGTKLTQMLEHSSDFNQAKGELEREAIERDRLKDKRVRYPRPM